jgi:purine-cytosine permease-like protein
MDDWRNYPLLVIYFSYLFVFHPLIIFLLNKKINKDIRNDYIYSMFILVLAIVFELIKYYVQFFTTFLTCISYTFIPIIKYYFENKNSDIKKCNNIVVKDIEIDTDINKSYINIYKKYFLKETS